MKVLTGDALTILKELPAELVQMCVTSPPYFGLRDYGVSGQIGLENSPEEFVEKLVAVFREVRRVLKDDGTLWLNLGDSYAGSGRGQCADGQHDAKRNKTEGMIVPDQPLPKGLKKKDLMGIPWRVAFALQADGWYLRQDIIWHKPNAMPEGVKDRCTKAHEYLFLFSKSPDYYFNHEAIKEPRIHPVEIDIKRILRQRTRERSKGRVGGTATFRNTLSVEEIRARALKGRNRRSVWSVCTKPYKGAHFAPFPPDLVEPCILVGAPPAGIVLDPFMGSGTTGYVARQWSRHFIGIELNPSYVELALVRMGISAGLTERGAA